jgi:hypothetical protein
VLRYQVFHSGLVEVIDKLLDINFGEDVFAVFLEDGLELFEEQVLCLRDF